LASLTCPLALKGFLWGRTRVGENIDDEWFITFLLLRITAEPGLGSPGRLNATVVDADGQFLLIEAADALPRQVGRQR
jgi:hypothetical protein